MGDQRARAAPEMAAPAPAPAPTTAERPVATAVRAAPAPRRLAVGAADDPLEREADRVAGTVVRSLAASGVGADALVGRSDTRLRRSGVSVPADVALSRTEPRIQRRNSKFAPFKSAGRAKQNVSVTALTLDTLNEHGLKYPTGGTLGNDVNLEKMVSDTGGGSAPGEPVEFGQFRMLHQPLVRAYNQNNAATAMHAINHNFADPAVTNMRPENIFMGSARSNTQIHFYLVELPIRDSMKKATSGAAAAYQTALLAHHPTACAQDPNLLLWDQVGMNMPGADVHNPPLTGLAAAPLPQATHSVDLDGLFNDVTWGGWPKMIQYRVVPVYSYQAWPNFPQFLLDNIAGTEQDILDEQAKTTPDNALIGLVQTAIARLKVIGPSLFPEDFRCRAVYWFPSYDPAAPWYQSTDADIYDAEA
jgi:hypothetical protein